MTIVAIGTTLPEIITGVIAARKDETDLLFGNIAGSNIVNLCLLIGIGAIINPIIVMNGFNNGILVLIAITIFLQFITSINHESKIDKKKGIMLIMMYIIYILSNY